jgi:hypothetical protein
MKKQLLLLSIVSTAFMISCGEEKKEEPKKEKTCKTYNDVKVDCADMENVEKLEELAFSFGDLDFAAGVGYAEVIAINEPILGEVEPLLPSLEKVLQADPEMAEDYFVTTIAEAMVEVEHYKTALVDLENLVITASWEQDPLFADEMDVMVRFTNTSTKPIGYLRGFMTYLDAEGNVLVEGDVAMYGFHFTPKLETEGDLIPVGYEGYTDMGLNLDKEKRALISTITFELIEVRYN